MKLLIKLKYVVVPLILVFVNVDAQIQIFGQCDQMTVLLPKRTTPSPYYHHYYNNRRSEESDDPDKYRYFIKCSGVKKINVRSYLCPDESECAELRFVNSNISDIQSNAFLDLTRIEEIYMDRCGVQKISTGAFLGLLKLRKIHLGMNNITHISRGVFNSLIALKILDISNNAIEEIESESFHGSPDIESLNMSFNKLKTLPQNLLEPLLSLTTLDISHNFLKAVNGNFRQLFSIKHLILNNNNLSEIDDDLYGKEISSLELSHNSIEKLIKLPSSLKNLDISYNNINHLTPDVFTNSTLLKSLNLSHNSLETIPSKAFEKLINLEELHISQNSITDIESFKLLNKLKILDLSANNLTILDQDSFTNFTSLIQLDLSMNRIDFIPMKLLGNFPNLNTLNISENQLEYLESGVFNNLESLQNLDLSHNKLNVFRPQTFQPLKSLNFLNLAFNGLSSIDSKELFFFRKQTTLDLDGNNFTCANLYKLFTLGVNMSRGKNFATENINGISCSDRGDTPAYGNFTDILNFFQNDFQRSAFYKFFRDFNASQPSQHEQSGELQTISKNLFDFAENQKRSLEKIVQKLTNISSLMENHLTENKMLNNSFHEYLVQLAGIRQNKNMEIAEKFTETIQKFNEELTGFMQKSDIPNNNLSNNINESFSKLAHDLERITDSFERKLKSDKNSLDIRAEKLNIDNDPNTKIFIDSLNQLKLLLLGAIVLALVIVVMKFLYGKIRIFHGRRYDMETHSHELPILPN